MYWQQLWDTNKRWLVVGLVMVVIIVAFFIWWLTTNKKPKDVILNTVTNQNSSGSLGTSTVDQIKAPEGGEAVVAARNFAERFGSYSNQNPYSNIRQLFPLMTSRLQASFSGSTSAPDTNYQGVDSRVISMKVTQSTAATAQIIVTLQRSERDASLKVTTYYQTLQLRLIKQANQWLVDAAEWMKK